MPYPIAHVMFFVFCISAVMAYTIFRTLLHKGMSASNYKQVLLLLFVGSISALLPDMLVVYSILVNGTREHCHIGPIPTHSLLFSLSAILFGAFVGYAVYKNYSKAFYMGIFSLSAFLSHLLLDDLARYEMDYFYPIYNKPISIFSYVDAEFASINLLQFILASYIAILSIFVVIMMALLALNHLGFEFRYTLDK